MEYRDLMPIAEFVLGHSAVQGNLGLAHTSVSLCADTNPCRDHMLLILPLAYTCCIRRQNLDTSQQPPTGRPA